MKLNVAVQMDPIARINIRGDSTFALLLEAQRRGHGGPLHAAHLVGLGKDREGPATCVEHRGAELFAIQVGWLGDAALLERHDRGRRVVVDHHDGHRLVGGVGVVGLEFHQGGQIGKAHVVAARGHALHRPARAVARIHRDIELGVLEIALGGGQQEQRGRAFKAPVELELDGGILGLGAAQGQGQAQGQTRLEEGTFFHRHRLRWLHTS